MEMISASRRSASARANAVLPDAVGPTIARKPGSGVGLNDRGRSNSRETRRTSTTTEAYLYGTPQGVARSPTKYSREFQRPSLTAELPIKLCPREPHDRR